MNMKLLSVFISVPALIIFCSCSKGSDTPIVPIPTPYPDTLNVGWTVTTLDSNGFIGGVNFSDIFFRTQTVGYAAGNGLWKSADGGITWYLSSYAQGKNLSVTLSGILFIVPYFTTNGLYRSDDGGQTHLNIRPPFPDLFEKIFFTGVDTGYMSTNLGILKTVNAGLNWTQISASGLPVGSLYSSLYFYNDNLGWICDSSNVYRTNGSISSWAKAIIHTTSVFKNVCQVFPATSTNIYLTVSNGEIYKSTDGGFNYYLKSNKFLNEAMPFSDLHFVNDNTGYVSFGRKIYKTTDGGTTWNLEVAMGETNITGIHFTDAQHGWACSSFRKLLKYTF